MEKHTPVCKALDDNNNNTFSIPGNIVSMSILLTLELFPNMFISLVTPYSFGHTPLLWSHPTFWVICYFLGLWLWSYATSLVTSYSFGHTPFLCHVLLLWSHPAPLVTPYGFGHTLRLWSHPTALVTSYSFGHQLKWFSSILTFAQSKTKEEKSKITKHVFKF